MRCTGSWLRILCAIAAGPACTGAPKPPPPPPRVALLTLDTWRLDHFDAKHSPRLWALSQQGERFDNAWTPIGLTSPAHATMFSGLMPWQHGMEGNNHHGYNLPEAVETVAERLQAAGYQTGAFVSAYPAGPEGGLNQGFEVFDGPADGERSGDQAVQAALDWLPADAPAFLWVHLYEPHGPYVGQGATDSERYAEEVARADALLAPLLERLVAEGARIVVAADHGEVLLEERCGRQHERSTHPVVLRVPLFRWAPGGPVAVHPERRSLADVAALLEGAPAAALPTRSLSLAESGLCEAGCAPGCAPAGLLGRDRVAIDDGGRFVKRPGRGIWAEGQPQGAHQAALEALPPVAPPDGTPDLEGLQSLGYRDPGLPSAP